MPPSCGNPCVNATASIFDPHCGANGVLYANGCQGSKCGSHEMFFACSLFLPDGVEEPTEEEIMNAYNECGTVCGVRKHKGKCISSILTFVLTFPGQILHLQESKIQDTVDYFFVPPAMDLDGFYEIAGEVEFSPCGPQHAMGDVTLDGVIDVSLVIIQLVMIPFSI